MIKRAPKPDRFPVGVEINEQVSSDVDDAGISGQVGKVLDGVCVLARMYAETGKEAEARTILNEIQGKPNSAFSIAEVYLALGKKEQALDYLRQAMKERCGWVVFMKVLPSLEALRSDNRFQKMIEQINFPSN
jgi:hypothetical protein